jgi:hypothetical protein
MAKKLNENAIFNELKGGSAFFRSAQPTEPPEKERLPKVEKKETPETVPSPLPPATPPPATHDTTIPRHLDTVIPRHRDAILETTRRAVKQFGKEAATHRFTMEEKRALKSVERDYEDKGIRTSENEITRISVNYMLEDYRLNGDKSILAHVLEMLNS